MSTSKAKQKSQGRVRKTKPNGSKLPHTKKKPMRNVPKYLISGFSKKK